MQLLGLPPNVREVVDGVRLLPATLPGIVGVALVGSWARAAGRADSDVDLVVVTAEPERLLNEESWFSVFGEGAQLIRAEDFGLLQERRLRRGDGLEVELGVGEPGWAATDPADAGAASVVRAGMQVLFDPQRVLSRFAAAVLWSRRGRDARRPFRISG